YRAYKKLNPSKPKPEKFEKEKPKTRKKKKAALNNHEQKEFVNLEKEIERLEHDKVQLEKEFLKDLSGEEIQEKSLELKEIEETIEEKTERWFELSVKKEGT